MTKKKCLICKKTKEQSKYQTSSHICTYASKDEFEKLTAEKLLFLGRNKKTIEKHCFTGRTLEKSIQILKDFKAQILKENPLSGLSDDELKMIISFTPKKTKQPQINKILQSGREKLNEILTRRKQLSNREKEVKK